MAVNQGLALSKDITSHVIEFIARTVHFSCPTGEKTFSMHELVRSLNVDERSKKMERFPIYTIEIGARAVKARATKSEGCIWHGSEHRWCDGNVPRPDQ